MNEMQTNQEEIFSTYRHLLFSIAYRLLGTVMDAEDCVQEVFLQWHHAIADPPKTTIEHPKAFLCTLVTRKAIDHLRSARVQREAYVGLWLPEPLVSTDPSETSEQAEALSIAFLRLLERLSPIERAVFLLRQVFDYDYTEIAAVVDKSAEHCRQIMHRARQHLALPRTLPPMPPEEQQQVFLQFLQACQNGNMDSLLHTLSEEIVLYADSGGKANAARNPIRGAENVARYLLGLQTKYLQPANAIFQPVQINGQPGLLGYLRTDDFLRYLHSSLNTRQSEKSEKAGRRETTRQSIEFYQQAIEKQHPIFALALTLADRQIQEIDIIVNPDKLRHISFAANYGHRPDMSNSAPGRLSEPEQRHNGI